MRPIAPRKLALLGADTVRAVNVIAVPQSRAELEAIYEELRREELLLMSYPRRDAEYHAIRRYYGYLINKFRVASAAFQQGEARRLKMRERAA